MSKFKQYLPFASFIAFCVLFASALYTALNLISTEKMCGPTPGISADKPAKSLNEVLSDINHVCSVSISKGK